MKRKAEDRIDEGPFKRIKPNNEDFKVAAEQEDARASTSDTDFRQAHADFFDLLVNEPASASQWLMKRYEPLFCFHLPQLARRPLDIQENLLPYYLKWLAELYVMGMAFIIEQLQEYSLLENIQIFEMCWKFITLDLTQIIKTGKFQQCGISNQDAIFDWRLFSRNILLNLARTHSPKLLAERLALIKKHPHISITTPIDQEGNTLVNKLIVYEYAKMPELLTQLSQLGILKDYLDVKDTYGQTPLVLNARIVNSNQLKNHLLLLASGASLKQTDANHNSALHFFALLGSYEAFLWSVKTDPLCAFSCKNKASQSPLSVAEQSSQMLSHHLQQIIQNPSTRNDNPLQKLIETKLNEVGISGNRSANSFRSFLGNSLGKGVVFVTKKYSGDYKETFNVDICYRGKSDHVPLVAHPTFGMNASKLLKQHQLHLEKHNEFKEPVLVYNDGTALSLEDLKELAEEVQELSPTPLIDVCILGAQKIGIYCQMLKTDSSTSISFRL